MLVVDDQSVVRAGFRALIDAAPDLEVVDEAADGPAAVAAAVRHRPDVVLMDVRMPGGDGIEATRALVERAPGSRVLVVSTFDLDEYVFASLRAGASGFVLKDIEPPALLEAIHTVHAGESLLSPSLTRRLIGEFVRLAPAGPPAPGPAAGRAPGPALSEREREVVRQVARGCSNVEIATELHVAESTVKTHVSSVLTKWGLRDRVQLVVRAFEDGLVDRSPP